MRKMGLKYKPTYSLEEKHILKFILKCIVESKKDYFPEKKEHLLNNGDRNLAWGCVQGEGYCS